MIACHAGKLDVVKMLLDHGAIVDAENNMGANASDIVYHRTKELTGLRRPENADTVDSRLTELSNIAALLDGHAACE